MLSYQHIYHAGNLADVHKHALLAWMLDYMTQKPKPLHYLETHAGRAHYDLSAAEARKTGEAALGITRVRGWFADGTPYARALDDTQKAHGADAYPGSPAIAANLLRPEDSMTLAELHPREAAALSSAMRLGRATILQSDGFEMALSRTPPTPRRGLLLCDPSYEVKSDYTRIPQVFAQLHRRWPVGILVLWYPLLATPRHEPMLTALSDPFPDALRHEVRFPPAREGHGMIGSGLFVVNPPFGLKAEAAALSARFAGLPAA